MRGRVLLGMLLALWTVVDGCGGPDEAGAVGGGEQMKPDWGVVLSGEEGQKLLDPCSRSKPGGLSRQWNPTRADIERVEKHLPTVLGNRLRHVIIEDGRPLPRPNDYYRQYAGFYRRGRRVVYVNGVHRLIVESSGRDPKAWMRTALDMCDGGFSTFGVLYDVELDTFGRLEFSDSYAGSVPMR